MPRAALSRPAVLALGLVALAWALFVSRWIAADAVVPWDSKNHFYPMLRFLGAAFARGEVPLWNPFHFGGHPSVADPQSLLFTPTLAWLAAVTPNPSLLAFDMVVFAHLLAGGLAAAALGLRFGWHPVAAAFVGLIVIAGGSAAGRLQHTGMIVSYALLPVAWLLLEMALARRSLALAAAFGVVAALMALGRDQVAFLGGLMLIAWAGLRVVAVPDRLAALKSAAPVLLVGGVVGAAILAVPALLTLQLLADSNRPEIGFGTAVKGSLSPANAATLIAPDVFGTLTSMYTYWGPGPQSHGPSDWTDPSVNYLFFGTLPALLFLGVGVAGGRLWRLGVEARFVLIAGALAALYALGRHTPAFELLFQHLPGVALYRRPADATFLFNIAAAFGVGALVDALVRRRIVVSPWVLAGVGAGAVGLLVWALTYAVRADRLSDAMPAALAGAAAVGLALAVLAVVGRLPRPALLLGLAFAVTAGELSLRNGAGMVNAEPRARYAVLEAPGGAERRALDVISEALVRLNDGERRPRVEIVGLPGPWMNAAMIYGHEDTVSYNPLRLEGYQRAVGPGENAGDINLRRFPWSFRGYHSMMARLLGIEIVAFDRPIERLPAHVPPIRGAVPLLAGPKVWVYRLPPAVPRVVLAGRARTVDGSALLAARTLPAFEPREEALIDAETPPERAHDGAGGRARIERYGANAIEIAVEAPGGGVLVLHDLWYPGWTAEVDGVRVPVLKANLIFRGVEVPAGAERVVFRFEPLSVAALGDAVAALGQDR